MTSTRQEQRSARQGWRPGGLELLLVGLVILVLFQQSIVALFDDSAALQAWATIFVSIVLQATPFLVFGVALSAVIAVFVPASGVQAIAEPANPYIG